jgi:F-type H+-transporting ATPase subunit delta
MATRSTAAKPYARALWELARERGQADAVLGELELVVQALRGDRDALEFFGRPSIPAAAKRAVAIEIAARLGVSPLVRDFLALVARQGRGGHLPDIVAVFRDLADEAQGRVRARVRTAVALTEAERAALGQRLAAALARRDGAAGRRVSEVVLEEVVDPSLLGGFIAEIGSMIVDGSLNGQLARIRNRLAHG